MKKKSTPIKSIDQARKIILAASKEFSKDLSRKQYLSSLLELEWHKSICWETGVDEGGFETKREIFGI